MTVLKKEKSTVLARRLITGEVVALQQGACCCSLPAYELQYMRCVQVERHHLAVCFLSRTVAALSHSVSPSLSSPTHYYARGPPAHSISLPLPAGLRTMPVLPPRKNDFGGLGSPPPPSQSLSWNQMGILLKTGVQYYKQHSVCLSSGRLD
jgi:hypothetical protein